MTLEPNIRQSPSQLLDFFSHSLTSFESSTDPFHILSTLPSSQIHPPLQPPNVKTRSGESILVLDSSFNPPTVAHKRMALAAVRWALQRGGRVRLVLLLAVNNADKEAKPAGFAQRLGMMEGFARGVLGECAGMGLEIDLAVTKMPYFYDKARAILQSREYSPRTTNAGLETENTQPELVFLVGFDTITRIFDPKYYTSSGGMKTSLGPFLQHSRLRVTSRPDDQWGSRAEQEEYVLGLAERLPRLGGDAAWASRIELEDVQLEGVSSSKVREVVKDGKMERLKGLVDEGVREWIEREGLYR